MSANVPFIASFAFFINVTGVLLGYAMAYSNQVTSLLNAKLGWYHDENLATQKQALIGTSVVVGMTIGAVMGGSLMKIGRRRAVLLSCTFGIVGNIITGYLSFTNLIIGRLLFGFSVGLFSSICPRFQEETYPTHLYDKLAPLYNFS